MRRLRPTESSCSESCCSGCARCLPAWCQRTRKAFGELVYGIATAMILAGALPVMMVRAVELLNAVLAQLTRVNIADRLPRTGEDPITATAMLLLVLWFAAWFVVKCMKRLVVLAVLTPIGPIAMLLRVFPQTRWVSGWWTRTWGGLLVSQVPAAIALMIGIQMAVF